MSSAGVSTLPTTSMTADCLMLRRSTTMKNATEKMTGETPLISGATLISKVVAAVRGMATMGPMQRIIALMSMFEATLPTRPVMFSLPPTLSSVKSAKSARPISAMK